jgi:hypothetical protein
MVVVINGPEANAGLNPILSSTSGISVPTNEANSTTEKSAKLTTNASNDSYEK